MEIKKVLKTIISNQHKTVESKKLLERDLKLPAHSEKIIVVSGVRRCGKTTLLKLSINQLVKQGIARENILFFSFDDERLQLKTDELDLIIQAYRELYPNILLKDCYMFFDEIQNIENWEKFIRRIYDNDCSNIYISGSNSKLLGSEIASSLRGRCLLFELYPLSFREYLQFKKVDTEYFSDKQKALILNNFNQYLSEGGFPETVFKNEDEKSMILNDYFQVLLFRDIIERYKITRIAALKFYILKIISNLGKPFSVNKIYNELKSQGIKTDKDSLYDILEYVEAVYLGFRLYKFDYSVINREMSDKKIFTIDNGLLNAISWKFSDDYGKLLENLIFIWLKQLYKNNVFFYSNKKECDFVVFDRDKAKYCVQVCYDISQIETRKREIAGLVNAMEYFGLKNGFIITMEQEEIISHLDYKISIIPAYKVFIDNTL